jgi:hypothetical protein
MIWVHHLPSCWRIQTKMYVVFREKKDQEREGGRTIVAMSADGEGGGV